MPTYHSRLTTVQLLMCSLSKSTTSNPGIYGSAETKAKLDAVAAELGKGILLRELPIYNQEDGSHIRFLGESQDMPFLMTHAGKDLFKQGVETKSADDPNPLLLTPATSPVELDPQTGATADPKSSGPTRIILKVKPKSSIESQDDNSRDGPRDNRALIRTPSKASHLTYGLQGSRNIDRRSFRTLSEPHALVLNVSLSRASFLRSYDPKLQKAVTEDLKIDVFFNGEFCTSSYIAQRYGSGLDGSTALTQQFSGRKIGRQVERPWIVVPPAQYHDRTSITDRSGEGAYDSAQQRWTALSNAITRESNMWPKKTNGDASLIGEYLGSLAKIAMPPEMNELQKAGGPSFGIIDIVITSGRGLKDGATTPFITEPTRLRLKKPYFPTIGTSSAQSKAKPPTKLPAQTVSSPTTAVGTTQVQHHRVHADAQIIAQTLSPRKPRLSIGPDPKTPKAVFLTPGAPSTSPTAVRRRHLAQVAAAATASKPNQFIPHPGAQQKPNLSPFDRLASGLADTRLSSPSFAGSDKVQGLSHRPSGPQIQGWNRRGRPEFEPNLDQSFRQSGVTGHKSLGLSPPNVRSSTLGASSIASRNTSFSSPLGTPDTSSVQGVGTPRLAFSPAESPNEYSKGAKRLPRFEPLNSMKSSSHSAHKKAIPESGGLEFNKAIPTPKMPAEVPDKGYRSSDLNLEDQPKKRSRRMPYEHVLTTKMTLFEEMESIQASTREEYHGSAPGTVSRSIRSRAPSVAPPVTTPISLTTPISTEDNWWSIAKPAETASLSNVPTLDWDDSDPLPLRPLSEFNKTLLGNDQESFEAQIIADHIAPQRQPGQSSDNVTKGTGSSWQTPALSQGSVLTYAEGMLRQVRTERRGWFEEGSVLMGVRYVLG